jgi:hypothetical protein
MRRCRLIEHWWRRLQSRRVSFFLSTLAVSRAAAADN